MADVVTGSEQPHLVCEAQLLAKTSSGAVPRGGRRQGRGPGARAQRALHAAWLEKKKAHDEALARGEKVGPLEPDPTAVQEVGILGLLKFIVTIVFIVALAGKFLTGSYTWESNSKWLQAKTYIPVRV